MAAFLALKSAYGDSSSGSDVSDEEKPATEENMIHLQRPDTAAAKLQLVQSAPHVITKVKPMLAFLLVLTIDAGISDFPD